MENNQQRKNVALKIVGLVIAVGTIVTVIRQGKEIVSGVKDIATEIKGRRQERKLRLIK